MNGGRACHAFEASRCDAINFRPLPSLLLTLSLFSTARGINSEEEGRARANKKLASKQRCSQVAPPNSPTAPYLSFNTTFRQQLFRGSKNFKVLQQQDPRVLTPRHIPLLNPRDKSEIFLRIFMQIKLEYFSTIIIISRFVLANVD